MLVNCHYYHHFTDQGTEAQRSEISCLHYRNVSSGLKGLNPGLSDSRAQALAFSLNKSLIYGEISFSWLGKETHAIILK